MSAGSLDLVTRYRSCWQPELQDRLFGHVGLRVRELLLESGFQVLVSFALHLCMFSALFSFRLRSRHSLLHLGHLVACD